MEFFPAPLENLVEQFARLPGIGSKSATGGAPPPGTAW
jgi:recombination protein RecR